MAEKSLKFTTNFSFKNLSSKINSIVDKAMKKEGQGVATESKKTIMSGTELKPLSATTIKKRIAGISDYEPEHQPSSTSNTKPLFYTGDLHDSIKAKDKSVEMFFYGRNHNEGIGEPKREFIAKPGSEKLKKTEDLIRKEMEKDIYEAMKK